jgi:hypothetical protein
MEPVIVLRRKPENAQRAAVLVPRDILRVGVPQQPLDAELAALDPDLGRRLDAVEYDGAAVGGRDDDARVVGRRAGAGVGFEGAVEEFVEVFEFGEGEEDFGEVQAVEGDEFGYLGFGGWVVVFFALLDAEALEEFADCVC